MKLLCLLLFVASVAAAQDLPDAPSVHPETLCHRESLTLRDESAGHEVCRTVQINDAPQPAPAEKHVTFWTFRKGPDAAPLRTNRQVLFSKTFLALNGALAASLIVDHHVTHNAREHYDSELPAVAGVIGLDYVADRFFSRVISVGPPVYGIIHYVRDALK